MWFILAATVSTMCIAGGPRVDLWHSIESTNPMTRRNAYRILAERKRFSEEMFIALAKLNCYEALTAAESLLATSDCSFASYAGIFAIESIVSDPPIGAPAFKKGMCVTVEKRTWQGWRRAHKNAVTAVCQYHCAG